MIETDSTVPLTLGLNDNTGYMAPLNLHTLQHPYLYFGFLPITHAQNNNVQGIKVGCVATVAAAALRLSGSTFYFARPYTSAVLAASHVSLVCMSVTRQCSVETNKRIKLASF